MYPKIVKHEKCHDPYASQWLRRNQVFSLKHTYSNASWLDVLKLAARNNTIHSLRSLVRALRPMRKINIPGRNISVPNHSIQLARKNGNTWAFWDVPFYVYNLHELPANGKVFALNKYRQSLQVNTLTDTMQLDSSGHVYVMVDNVMWGPVHRIAIECEYMSRIKRWLHPDQVKFTVFGNFKLRP